MDHNPERRRYYLGEENVPLSEAIREAVAAHESSEVDVDCAALSDHLDVETIDHLFPESDYVSVTLQLGLPNVIVDIWSDEAVDIRVTGEV